MPDFTDRFKMRQAQTLAFMDRNDGLIAGAQRMPEAWDYIATPITAEKDTNMHDAVRAARRALSSGEIKDYDLIEFLSVRLPGGSWSTALWYLSIFEGIGDERH